MADPFDSPFAFRQEPSPLSNGNASGGSGGILRELYRRKEEAKNKDDSILSTLLNETPPEPILDEEREVYYVDDPSTARGRVYLPRNISEFSKLQPGDAHKMPQGVRLEDWQAHTGAILKSDLPDSSLGSVGTAAVRQLNMGASDVSRELSYWADRAFPDSGFGDSLRSFAEERERAAEEKKLHPARTTSNYVGELAGSAIESFGAPVALGGAALAAGAGAPVLGAAVGVGALAGIGWGTLRQMQGVYQEAQQEGASEDRAREVANQSGLVLAGIETIGAAPLFNILNKLPGGGQVKRNIARRLARKLGDKVDESDAQRLLKEATEDTFEDIAEKTGKSVEDVKRFANRFRWQNGTWGFLSRTGQVVAGETLEEMGQQVYTNYILQEFNSDIPLTRGLLDSAAGGAGASAIGYPFLDVVLGIGAKRQRSRNLEQQRIEEDKASLDSARRLSEAQGQQTLPLEPPPETDAAPEAAQETLPADTPPIQQEGEGVGSASPSQTPDSRPPEAAQPEEVAPPEPIPAPQEQEQPAQPQEDGEPPAPVDTQTEAETQREEGRRKKATDDTQQETDTQEEPLPTPAAPTRPQSAQNEPSDAEESAETPTEAEGEEATGRTANPQEAGQVSDAGWAIVRREWAAWRASAPSADGDPDAVRNRYREWGDREPLRPPEEEESHQSLRLPRDEGGAESVVAQALGGENNPRAVRLKKAQAKAAKEMKQARLKALEKNVRLREKRGNEEDALVLPALRKEMGELKGEATPAEPVEPEATPAIERPEGVGQKEWDEALAHADKVHKGYPESQREYLTWAFPKEKVARQYIEQKRLAEESKKEERERVKREREAEQLAKETERKKSATDEDRQLRARAIQFTNGEPWEEYPLTRKKWEAGIAKQRADKTKIEITHGGSRRPPDADEQKKARIEVLREAGMEVGDVFQGESVEGVPVRGRLGFIPSMGGNGIPEWKANIFWDAETINALHKKGTLSDGDLKSQKNGKPIVSAVRIPSRIPKDQGKALYSGKVLLRHVPSAETPAAPEGEPATPAAPEQPGEAAEEEAYNPVEAAKKFAVVSGHWGKKGGIPGLMPTVELHFKNKRIVKHGVWDRELTLTYTHDYKPLRTLVGRKKSYSLRGHNKRTGEDVYIIEDQATPPEGLSKEVDAVIVSLLEERAKEMGLLGKKKAEPAKKEADVGFSALPSPVEGEEALIKSTQGSPDVKSVRTVLSANEILTSDQKGYPSDLQPRKGSVGKDASSNAALQADVAAIAKSGRMDLLTGGETWENGSPIVAYLTFPDGKKRYVVISGNTRIMGMRRGYRNGRGNEWKADLKKAGFDPKGKMNPIPVRVINESVDGARLKSLAEEANRPSVQSFSATSEAKALVPKILSALESLPQGVDARESRPFQQAFARALPQNQRARLTNPQTNQLNAEGRSMLDAVLREAAYGGEARLDALLDRLANESRADNTAKTITDALTMAAGQMSVLRAQIKSGAVPAEFDLIPVIAEAIKIVQTAGAARKIASTLSQQDAFATPAREQGEQLLSVFYRRGKKGDYAGLRSASDVAASLREYAASALKQSNQGTLPGVSNLSQPTLLSGLATKAQKGSGEIGLFGDREHSLGAGGVFASAPVAKPVKAKRAKRRKKFEGEPVNVNLYVTVDPETRWFAIADVRGNLIWRENLAEVEGKNTRFYHRIAVEKAIWLAAQASEKAQREVILKVEVSGRALPLGRGGRSPTRDKLAAFAKEAGVRLRVEEIYGTRLGMTEGKNLAHKHVKETSEQNWQNYGLDRLLEGADREHSLGTGGDYISAVIGISPEALKKETLRIVKSIAPHARVELVNELLGKGEAVLRSGGTSRREQEVAGEYIAAYNLVRLSINFGKFDPRDTAYHEAFRALWGLMTPAEQAALTLRYPARGHMTSVSKMAYAFTRFARGKRDGLAAWEITAFNKIFRFLRRFGNFLRGRGFMVWEDVFADALSGKIGRRALPRTLERAQSSGNAEYSMGYVRSLARRLMEAEQDSRFLRWLVATSGLDGDKLESKLSRIGVNFTTFFQDKFAVLDYLSSELDQTDATGEDAGSFLKAYLGFDALNNATGYALRKAEEKRLTTLQNAHGELADTLAQELGENFRPFVGVYLLARGAKERNAYIKKREMEKAKVARGEDGERETGEFYDNNPASGMSDADADTTLNLVENDARFSKHKKAFDEIAALADNLAEAVMTWMVDGKLISKKGAADLRKAMPHWMHLSGNPVIFSLEQMVKEAETEQSEFGTEKSAEEILLEAGSPEKTRETREAISNFISGLSVRRGGAGQASNRSFRAQGRRHAPVNVVENTIEHAVRVIRRAEINKAMVGLAEAVRENEDVLKEGAVPVLSGGISIVARGTIIETNKNNKTNIPLPPAALSFRGPQTVKQKDGSRKETGEIITYYIKTDDVNLSNALMGFSASQIAMQSQIMRYASKALRFFASLVTTWNPAFLPVNAIRDFIQGQARAVAQYDKGTAKLMRKHYRKLAKPYFQYVVGRKTLDEIRSQYGDEIADILDEAQKYGSIIRFGDLRDLFQVVDDSRKRLSAAQLNRAGGARAYWRKFAAGVENMNRFAENISRVSTFAALRENGMNPTDAARQAREITVPFTRKGSIMDSPMGSLYLFLNPILKSPWVVKKTLMGRRGRQVAGFLFLTGFLQALINHALTDDEEDRSKRYSELPEYQKYSNLVIPTGEGWGMLPTPYGLNILIIAGQTVAEMLMGHKSPLTAVGTLASEMTQQFNPVASLRAGWLEAATPTLARPITQVLVPYEGQHLDPFGRLIYPRENSYQTKDDYQKHFSYTGETWKFLTKGMFDLSGGRVDISPETIKLFGLAYSGGVGRFAERSFRVGRDVAETGSTKINRIPIARRFFTKGNTSAVAQAFWTQYAEDKALIYRARGQVAYLKQTKDRETVRQFVEMVKESGRAHVLTPAYGRFLDKVRKAIVAIEDPAKKDEAMEKALDYMNNAGLNP